MKKQKKLLVVLALLCMILLPVFTVKADQTPLKMVVSEVKNLPNVYWFSKFTTSDATIASVDTSGNVTANAVGTAVISQTTLSGKEEYIVTVTDVVDIVVTMGQSNMCGSGGDLALAPEVKEGGLVYANGVVSPLNRQGTLIPSFVNSYYAKTNVPVITIQTAIGGSGSKEWIKAGLANGAAGQLTSLKKYLSKYPVKVRHIYMLWFQGETDAKQGISKTVYMKNMQKIYKKMHGAGVEKCLIIQIGKYRNDKYPTSTIIDAQKTLCKKNKKKFAMVSTVTASLSKKSGSYADNVHFNQKSLNKIGAQAGKKAGALAQK